VTIRRVATGLAGLALFRPLVDNPAGVALLSDLDGTLAPIVDDPAAARPVAGVPGLLGRLAAHLGTVGVVSGRPASFLAERLAGAGPDVTLVGIYGLERVTDGLVVVAPDARRWVDAVAQLTARAEAQAPAGVTVEAKHVTVALHWRTAPEHARWCQDAARRWAAETGLVVVPARMAVELRPPIRSDKGTAVSELAAGSQVVVYAGDDAGDIPAFDALDRMAAGGVSQVVKVAVADSETPPQLTARADLVLSGPSAWVALLERLADALDQTAS